MMYPRTRVEHEWSRENKRQKLSKKLRTRPGERIYAYFFSIDLQSISLRVFGQFFLLKQNDEHEKEHGSLAPVAIVGHVVE